MGFDSPLILWVPIVAALVLAGLLSRQPAARPPLAVWTVLGLLAVLAIRVHRVAPLMGPAALVLLAQYLTRDWGHVGRLRVHNRQAARVLWIPALVALADVAPPPNCSVLDLSAGTGYLGARRSGGRNVERPHRNARHDVQLGPVRHLALRPRTARLDRRTTGDRVFGCDPTVAPPVREGRARSSGRDAAASAALWSGCLDREERSGTGSQPMATGSMSALMHRSWLCGKIYLH